MLDLITLEPSAIAVSFLSLISASAFSMAAASLHTLDIPDLFVEFQDWKKSWNVTYPSEEVENVRREVWINNKCAIDEHNLQNKSWKMGLNQFSDQTDSEFQVTYNGLNRVIYPRPSTTYPPSMLNLSDLPKSVDWREHGIVNPVKNQAQCGSCWAFSAIASLEGQYALKHKNLTSFSEQDLVDCVLNVQVSGGECCDGCEGGLMDAAFDYIVSSQNGATDLENKYAYTAMDGDCAFAADGPGLGDVTGHVDLVQGCDHSLQSAVATVGVISVGVDANYDWQTYAGGVYVPDESQGGCSSDPGALDHGVAVVGYNTDDFLVDGKKKSLDYWIIRNSWDTSWGIDGYMYLSRDVKNACGLSNYASYPTLGGNSTVGENQCQNSHPQCPSEVCYTQCPCNCFIPSSTSPCDCSAATCSC